MYVTLVINILYYLLKVNIFLVYCNWAFDSILCWPPTEAGEIAYQRCPTGKVTDSSSK